MAISKRNNSTACSNNAKMDKQPFLIRLLLYKVSLNSLAHIYEVNKKATKLLASGRREGDLNISPKYYFIADKS